MPPTTILRALAGSLALASCALAAASGQPTADSPLAPPPNGVRRVEPAAGFHAFTGATLHVSPTRTIENATLVIRDGRIVAAEAGAPAPPGAQAHDAAGLHLYPGFIEPLLSVEVPRPDLNAPGAHWNPRITPQRSALDKGSRGVDEKTGDTLREMGFVAAGIAPEGGIFRGRGAVVSLDKPSGDPSQVSPRVYRADAFHAVAFETQGWGGGDERPDDVRWSRYPGSLMGAIALIRQTLSDADWQAEARRAGRLTEPPNALDALAPDPSAGAPPLLFDAGDPLDVLRAVKIAREFERPCAIVGSGREYQRLEAIVDANVPLVVPLAFPSAPEVGGVGEANAVELAALMHWEQAPTNPRRLAAALAAKAPERTAQVSLTTGKIGDREGGRAAFDDRLSTAIKHGLAPDQALAMLTTNPARLLGVADRLGTLEPGKVASFILTDGALFQDRPDEPATGEPGHRPRPKILSVWIDGREHIINPRPDVVLSGRFDVTFDPPPSGRPGADFSVHFNFTDERQGPVEFTIVKTTRDADGHEQSTEVKVDNFTRSGPGLSRFTFSFDHEPFGEEGVFLNTGIIERRPDGAPILRGGFVRSSGKRMTWVARRTGDPAPRKHPLAGAWPMLFEQAPQGTLPGAGPMILAFDRGNVPTLILPPGVRDAEGRSPRLDDFKYDGREITARFDQSQANLPGAEGEAKIHATIDWQARPPRMRGTCTLPDGTNVAWTSIRREPNPFAGQWRITQAEGQAVPAAGPGSMTVRIGGRREKPTIRLQLEPRQEAGASARPPVHITAEEAELRLGKLFFKHDLSPFGMQGHSSDEITITWDKDDPARDTLVGLGRLPDGSVHPYQAARADDPAADRGREAAAIAEIPEQLRLPFGPYGIEPRPQPERLVLTGATIWTCADGPGETVIHDGAVVIADGKIQYVGPSASLPRLAEGYEMIDLAGRYITPGIIDCHSHTGISRGVNEAGQAVTSEVRIADVTNPDDVSWYRQLAGGVTCVNNLHGSANAIGGQSMVNKIRWGCTHPDEMHFEAGASSDEEEARGARPGIKFALGENPKQSNWGDRSVTRYPQTRMGVETLIRDRFTAAREYIEARKRGARRDLELEALAEILEGRRLVHCHSYRQDEILMLCRVARDFGFRIGTFQHILEGYKVADELVKWSGGGSAFSDWWAYKFEVVDAIPGAGPLMAEQGLLVSYNSDSDEMARRLNVEAGKAAKYSRMSASGPIPPHEAFKFVTLNPARQLGADRWIGSLEPGKDADIAVWSGVPTSATSRCEMTLVDGRRLFSLETDRAHREHIASERARLVQKVLTSGDRARGKKGRGRGGSDSDDDPPTADRSAEVEVRIDLRDARAAGRRLLLLEAVRQAEDYRSDLYLNMLNRGLDPRWSRIGDCGCDDLFMFGEESGQ